MSQNDIVTIVGTEELPTRWNGSKATIWKQWQRFPEFYTVLIWDKGETGVFHISQLKEMENDPEQEKQVD